MRKCAKMIRWARDRSLHLDRKFFPATGGKIFNIRFGGGFNPGGGEGDNYQKTVFQIAREVRRG